VPRWEDVGVAAVDLTEAVAACRASGGTGWDLVDYSTRLVNARFETYSVLHPWESPAVAFRQRRGSCTQYNGALAAILREIGFEAWLAYAWRVRLDDRPDWSLGHAWVRVRVGTEVRDVCARSARNRPGLVHFEPVGRVHTMGAAAYVVGTVGSFLVAVAGMARARLRGRPRPAWVERPRAVT
jgi:transglutaminase-like putative cysteine protease